MLADADKVDEASAALTIPIMTIAIATCAQLPDGDEDADLLRRAFAERGIDARWRVWNDAEVRLVPL